MATPLPFSISPEAADYLRSVMRRPLADEELALITVHRQAEMVGEQERFSFDGEHFMICFYDVGRRPQAEHIELFGYRVSIVQSTLESLRGRTLTVRRVADSSGELRDVLVASS